MSDAPATPTVVVERSDPHRVVVRVSGNWRVRAGLPRSDAALRELGEVDPSTVLEFESVGLAGWDSGFVAFVARVLERGAAQGVQARTDGLPEGVQRLLRLSQAAAPVKDARRPLASISFVRSVGESGMGVWAEAAVMVTFLGESAVALGRLVRGRAQFRWGDALLAMQECGPRALGIVALINFLIGLILAFVGATGLAPFGATIYVADMVAIGTVREMACIMTGIILCGRTGASFAAELGTMKVNEEIVALQTFGISPMEFLVLPRMVALILMMPVLCVFADVIGVAGGFLMALGVMETTVAEYGMRTLAAVDLKSFVLGVAKGSFFGFLVAFMGCLRGMQCGTNAAAVGRATTRAVVAGITAIIASDGVFAVLCHVLHW